MVHPIAQEIDRVRVINQSGGHRTHLGISLIGKECSRQIWYSYRWARGAAFSGRMLRLFDRGHDEEARIIGWLRSIGAVVYDTDPTTRKQHLVSELGGHFGGSADGIVENLERFGLAGRGLLEMKTHNTKSFLEVVKKGVTLKTSKPVHWVQMQMYMDGLGLPWGLYVAVNKNDDALHIEEVKAEPETANKYRDKARAVVAANEAPPKINLSPSWFLCRMCEYRQICHYNQPPEKNCRSCIHAEPDTATGGWQCRLHGGEIPKDFIQKGCDEWEKIT